jgi:hypothetical protein
MVEELLTLAPVYERYKLLEKAIKGDLVELKHTEVEIAGKGRVFISQGERVTVPIKVAVDALGEDLASRVIVTKRFVSNDIVAAFVKAEEISQEQREKLLKGAERQPVTSLYVRPLK